MREAISITTIFQIFILFVLLFTAIMCLTINNSNAFGVKDSIINVIEANDGNYLDGADLSEEIVNVIAQTSYRTSGTCPDGYEGYDRSGSAVSNNSSDAAVCIRKVETTKEMDDYLASILGEENVGTDDFVEGTYYQVVLFFQLDIPVIKQIFNFQTKGETRTIYNTVEAAEEAPGSVNLPSYNNPGNSNPTTPGTDNNVNPVRNYGTAGNSNTGGNNNSNTEKPENPTTPIATCNTDGIELDTTLQNVQGVTFGSPEVNIGGKYGILYSDQTLSTQITKMNLGTVFTISGTTIGNNNRWYINYQGQCGWVDGTYLGIDIGGYISAIGARATVNITNKSSSIFKVYGTNIDGVTGKALYNGEFTIAPLQFSFAKKVGQAAKNANAAGDTLVIYETYRPQTVTKELYPIYKDYVTSHEELYSRFRAAGKTNLTVFFASNSSQHNRGCAVDVSLLGKEMPSEMHEISPLASASNTNSATLQRYFTSAGASPIGSEWWHFESPGSCINVYSSFWSAM